MIPTQTFDAYPVFGDNSTKAAPDSAKYAQGFMPADVLPAEWMNYFFYHNSKGITALNQGLLAVEQELNAILTAGGAIPNGTSGQVLDAIKYVIQTKTGNLTALNTTAKGTIVAAVNEILAALNSHKADTTNPHQVTGSQLAGPVPTAKIADEAVTAAKVNASAYNYARILYGETETEAATQLKEVTIANLTSLSAGVEIRVKFTNGNTAGTCVGTSSNLIAADAAPRLKVNGFTDYPIKVGGEFAGEGFIKAGDVHNFLFDGSAWVDLTTDVIYQGQTSNGNYLKKRSGLIEQWGIYNGGATQNLDIIVSLPIPFNDLTYNATITGENTGSNTVISRTGIRKISTSSFAARCSGPTSSDRPSAINWFSKDK